MFVRTCRCTSGSLGFIPVTVSVSYISCVSTCVTGGITSIIVFMSYCSFISASITRCITSIGIYMRFSCIFFSTDGAYMPMSILIRQPIACKIMILICVFDNYADRIISITPKSFTYSIRGNKVIFKSVKIQRTTEYCCSILIVCFGHCEFAPFSCTNCSIIKDDRIDLHIITCGAGNDKILVQIS